MLDREELSAFSDAGVITKLAVAFSRDADAEYKYVQHALMAHAADCSRFACTWISQALIMLQHHGGGYYVCLRKRDDFGQVL